MHETHHQSLSRAKRFWSQRRLIIFALSICGGVWGSHHVYESYQARRARVVRAGFAHHLGPHSVIRVYAPAYGESESLVEALDLKTGVSHWQTWTEEISSSGYRGQDLDIGADLFVLTGRDYRPHERVRLAVHRLKDGELLWDHH